MKERYYAPGQPPKGYSYRFYQDGWLLVKDDSLPLVHSNYNAKIGVVSGIGIFVAIVAALLYVL